MADGRCRRIQLDTYERGVASATAGRPGWRSAEQMFAIDSDACLAVLDLMGGDEGLDAAWRSSR